MKKKTSDHHQDKKYDFLILGKLNTLMQVPPASLIHKMSTGPLQGKFFIESLTDPVTGV